MVSPRGCCWLGGAKLGQQRQQEQQSKVAETHEPATVRNAQGGVNAKALPQAVGAGAELSLLGLPVVRHSRKPMIRKTTQAKPNTHCTARPL